ncbi:CpeS-like protein [Rubidibacter lacunae KORDI 51-2]|uniref:Chromophore lyase CpcS/CpeS n=1 Tax=Rubidibacter lacunae KORDI 51-2 TaxID=582515 RepID=U5DH50_9CHRO|nr:phycobiliprotein lyase [Rubidibacter lacunae]ERN39884.1 CpeS-like protein [Rubidibacter lacunae KORDI 51-2]
MDIREFCEQSTGTWFVQRTHYDIDGQTLDSGKADIAAELVGMSDPQVAQLCQRAGIAPEAGWICVKTSWDTAPDPAKPKATGSALLLLLPDADGPDVTGQTGRIVHANLRELDSSDALASGSYRLATDALSLTIATESVLWEERIWFANSNLRMRTVHKRVGDRVQAAFYSEIRRVGT